MTPPVVGSEKAAIRVKVLFIPMPKESGSAESFVKVNVVSVGFNPEALRQAEVNIIHIYTIHTTVALHFDGKICFIM